MSTERQDQDSDCAHRIAWASGPAVRAAVDPPVRAPLPAYGTRLRGIGFAAGDRPSRRVVQQVDDLTGTGTTYRLGRFAPGTLGGASEWLAPIARRARERHRHLARGLLAEIAPPGCNRPALPASLAGPRPSMAAEAVMPPHAVLPQPAASRRLAVTVTHSAVLRGRHARSTVR